jgi:hypothetical protein
MKLMTEVQLAKFLETFKGASFVSVTTETMPRVSKSHKGRIKRIAVRPGMIGASYENAVQNRRISEDHVGAMEGVKFDALSLWNGAGEHVSTALVRHRTTGRLYMVLYPKHNTDGDVCVSDSQWMLDGQPVSLEAIKDYLPAHKEGSERQETARPVPWRVIGLDGIVSLTVNGDTYTIVH